MRRNQRGMFENMSPGEGCGCAGTVVGGLLLLLGIVALAGEDVAGFGIVCFAVFVLVGGWFVGAIIDRLD